MATPYLDTGHVRTSVSWTSSGTTYLTYMYQANRTTRGPFSFQKWYTCRICAKDFPGSEIMHIQGAPYCTRYEHATEKIADINRGKNNIVRSSRKRFPG